MVGIHELRMEGVEPEPPSGLVERVWSRDPSAWPSGEDDPVQRLGWLDLPRTMRDRLDDLRAFARRLADEVDTVVLLGMGGSSLAPEMYARTFGSADGYPALVVLDSTHPDRILQVREGLRPDHTAFIVSSKSGTTLETISLYRYFRSVVDDGRRFVAVTDPGSPLQELAEEEGFRTIFPNPPDIGGRYSALSLFGLVPAAVCGLDTEGLLDEAAAVAGAVAPQVAGQENPGLLLGTALAELARRGRDKATFLISEQVAAFGDWVEQLLAESTGKQGTGVVPIVHEPQVDHTRYDTDRAFVRIALADDRSQEAFLDSLVEAGHPVIRLRIPRLLGVGGQIFLWEFATAVAGSILDVNAFDQPNVEAAKQATRRVLAQEREPGWDEEDPKEVAAAVRPGGHVALLAFAVPDPDHAAVLNAARRRVLLDRGAATSGAFGPRYLHSSGQLHKGGPEAIRALVVLEPPTEDIPIPGRDFGFDRLIRSQAAGDVEALRLAGRPTTLTTWDRFAAWTEDT